MSNDQERVDPIEVLMTAKEYLERLIPGVANTADYLRNGNEHEGSRMMVYIVDGLQWLADAIMLTTEHQVEKIDFMEITPFFTQINEALENLDYIFLGDLLEYEIVPILETWKLKLLKTVGV